jgi:sugar (pentulose or hexulose) kinase
MNCIAFDLGGSGGKVVLGRFDGNQLQVESLHRFDHVPCAINGGLYWDIFNIYHQMNVGIRKAVGATADRITSLGIDSFSNDFALIDRSGELLTHVRCYRDARTERYKKEIYAKIPPERLYMLSGNQIAPFNTYMQIAAMREAQQGYLLDHAHRLLFLPDLLIQFLSGEEISEYSISSVSQMFDFAAGDWNDEILSAIGIQRSLFGRLTPPGTIIGSTRTDYNDLLVSRGFSLTTVCEHDTASAFLACTSEQQSAIISSGTWALVGVEVQEPLINRFGFEHNIANEGGYPGRHRLLRNVMGTWLLQEVRADYGLKGMEFSYADLLLLASQATQFAFLIDVDDPLFFSQGNMPQKIRDICAAHYGRAPQTVGELTRCICESLALKYRWSIEKLEQLTGKSFPSIHILGGGSKDALTCQFTANACGRPVVAGPDEATALGNLLVQLIAKNEISNPEQGKQVFRNSVSTTQYTPADIALWEEHYQRYKALYKLC